MTKGRKVYFPSGENCSHGLAVDMRYGQPLLLVCDRENRRLSHYGFDGKLVGNVTLHMRRPCQVSFWGDYAVVSDLEGRVTILDKDNAVRSGLADGLFDSARYVKKTAVRVHGPRTITIGTGPYK